MRKNSQNAIIATPSAEESYDAFNLCVFGQAPTEFTIDGFMNNSAKDLVAVQKIILS